MHQYLYIVFSSTPYRIGKIIRYITRENYNHVSISLDADFSQMYSFGRRYYRTPLYGGFIKESPARHNLDNKPSHIQVCKIPVTQAQYESISGLLLQMYQEKDRYLYNHLSALLAPFHISWDLQDAYTCVEFCAKLLSTLDLPVKQQFYSVDSLRLLLQDYVIYTGPMNKLATDATFFNNISPWYGFTHTFKSLIGLIPRINRT